MTLSVVVTTTPQDVEFVSDLLWSLGVVAIEEHWDPDGVVRLQTSLGNDPEVVANAMNSLPADLAWSTKTVDDDVVNTWREFAHPTAVGNRILIAPVWCDEIEIAAAREQLPDSQHALVIAIEPASTFGMGDHPTTMCSLLMLEKYLQIGDTVIDVGCGSGVLGITALKLGASRSIGTDINPSCVEVSKENARLNEVSDLWMVTTEPLAVIGSAGNIVVANILAPALIELSSELKRLRQSDGKLIVSGILQGHYDHVSEALLPLKEIDQVEINGWVAAVFS